MRPLRTYSLLNNLASSLVNPFISFLTASYGITGLLLAITTSASTTYPGIVQFLLVNFTIRAKKLLVIGTFFMGIFWITIGVLQIHNFFLVFLYVATNVALGFVNFGWLLILDKISESSRGKTLASFNFYSTTGGLLATLITGLIVGDKYNLMRYFFISAGLIYLFNSFIISRADVDANYYKTNLRINHEIRKFILISFLFTFIWSTAWPIFPLAQVFKYHMNEFQIAVIDVIGGMSTLSLSHIVGKLVDKFKTKVMFLGRLALATYPLAYALSPNVSYIYIAYLMSGFTNSASISYTAYIFDNTSYEEKKSAIALYTLFNGIAAFAGASVSSIIFSYISVHFGIILSINLLMLSIGILRILSSLLYLKIREIPRRKQSI